MDAVRQQHLDHPSAERPPALGEVEREADSAAGAARALRRLTAGALAGIGPDAVLALQRAVGNRAVERALGAGGPGQTGPLAARTEAEVASRLAKTIDQEDELTLAKTQDQEDELTLAKTRSTRPPLVHGRMSDGRSLAPTLRRTTIDVATTGVGGEPTIAPAFHSADRQAAAGLLAKAALDLDASATPSRALGPKDYGLTFPERVGVEIGATLDAGAKTWKPVVKKLIGRYSQQVRILPGQAEITGPGGNTTKTNFCAQCQSLEHLGNLPVGSHPWYVVAAVTAHENVHATRFKPALEDAEAAITTAIEAVSVPHTDPMTEAEAVTKLEADGAYQSAVARAYQLWLAKCVTRVARDHAFNGPTDTAEKTVTEPLRTRICAHAKKNRWGACDSCP